MKDLTKIYHPFIPEEIKLACKSQEMLRLKDVDMNCGCLYTSFSFFQKCDPYSRYEHSIGVALISYHFSHDIKQALAGLFHDIATPAFAHVIDFAKGDYTTQEATEMYTEDIISHSNALCEVIALSKANISEVSDYHIYPICDNNSPKLSADRLEYTLGNIVNYGFGTVNDIAMIYNDLILSTNEFNETEIVFQTEDIAEKFTELMIQCAQIYIADMDRYSMEKLAQIINRAIANKVITEADLYTTENEVIEKLLKNENSAKEWMDYCKTDKVIIDDKGMVIAAKKRYINAYVLKKGRIADINSRCHRLIEDFLNIDLGVKLLEVRQ